MAIGKKTYIVTVEYPNGQQVTRDFNLYSGNTYVWGYDSKYVEGTQALNSAEHITFPTVPAVGDPDVYYKVYFPGSFEGESLPPLNIWFSRHDASTLFVNYGMAQVHGKTIVGGHGTTVTGYIPQHIEMLIAPLSSTRDDSLGFAFGPFQNYGRFPKDGPWGTYLSYSGSYDSAETLVSCLSSVAYGYPFGPIDDPDKYESKPTDGNEGTMTDTSDPIEIDSVPPAVVAGGLFRIYEMNNVQLTNLSNILVDPDIIQQLVRTVTSPWDYIISLKAIPCVFPATAEQLRIGNYTVSMSTGNPKRVNTFLMDIDCGEVSIPIFFGSFLDWSPWTSATLYLPCIGYVQLNIDKFVGDVVKIKYRVDVVSGDCVAFISNSQGLVATYSGNCSYTLPLRANDSSQLISGLFGAVSGLMSKNYGEFSGSAMQMAQGVYKPNIVTASGLSANSGVLGNRKPYLIIERPIIALPRTYPDTIGYMSRISAKLSTLHGLTVVEEIHLENTEATEEEKNEILRLLKEGVILP